MEDQKAIQNILSGDLDSFKILIKKYEKPLFHFVEKFVFFNKEICEDIIQETLINAYRYLNKYNPSFSFKTWLFQIAINEAKKKLKVQKNRINNEINIDTEILNNMKSKYKLEEEVMQKELFEELHRIINLLNPKYQIVIRSRFFQDLKINEIAELLDESERNIKYKLKKAMEIIKKEFEKRGYKNIEYNGEF